MGYQPRGPLQTILMMYLLAATLLSLLFMFGGWRRRQTRALAAISGPPARTADLDLGSELQADVRASVGLALQRLLPLMTSGGVRADVAVPEGLLVQLGGTALTDLLECLLVTAINHDRASRLLLTAMIDGGQVWISLTNNTASPGPATGSGSVQGLADQVELLGGWLKSKCNRVAAPR
jgi:hypothetical protein